MTLFTKNPKTYKIKKGNHSSGLHFGITLKDKITLEVEFDQTCLEKLPNPDNYDINKLYGFSDSYWHHKYSARFGWRCINLSEGKIEIVTYCYVNGQRVPEYTLGKVKPGEKVKLTLENTSYSYEFTCATNTDYGYHTVLKDEAHKWNMKYNLYPYHGGNLTAPHDMKIKIKLV